MSSRLTSLRVATATIACCLVAGTAGAQDSEQETPDSYGRHGTFGRIVPYLWLSNIDGRNTIGDTLIHVGDTDLNTDFAFLAEYGKGRWRGIFEFSTGSVANVAEKGVDPSSVGGHCCGPDQVALVDGPYELTITSAEILASVQVGPFSTTRGIEVQGGFRYVSHSQTLGLTDPVLVGEFSTSWVEPVVGLRYYAGIGEDVWFRMRSNFGGFGMGSTFTWVLDGEVGYRIADNLDLSLRYKYLETEYRNSSAGLEQYEWDNGQSQGWYFGVGYRW